MEPTGPAWLPVAVFCTSRGHRVFRVASAKAADLRRFGVPARQEQDRVCSAQLSNLPLELAEPGGLGRRRAWPAAGIDLGLGHPTA
jgi:hypothetical protein